jgi:YVTN family beta-propeller protein
MARIILAAVSAAALLLAASPAFAYTIFVSNEKDNTITVIDSETLQTIKTIKTERRPRGIVLSPDNKELFVAAGDGDIEGRDHLHRQRGRFPRDDHGHQERRGARRGSGRRRA